MQGTPIYLYRNHNDFSELVGIVETESEVAGKFATYGRQSSETSSMSSNSSAEEDLNNLNRNGRNDEGVQLEASSEGKGSLTLHYFRTGANWSRLLTLTFLFVFVQFLASAIDYFVSVW